MIRSKEDLKLADIYRLIDMYSQDAPLWEILDKSRQGRIHVCPKCGGNGYLVETYDAYPKGLPDSGWATDYRKRDIECDLCDGQGYTVKKMIAKTVKVEYVEEK